jgi:hypothetical protein
MDKIEQFIKYRLPNEASPINIDRDLYEMVISHWKGP